MIFRAKIPLRISFSGGGTDVDPFCNQFGGNIISSTISKYVYASLEERRDEKIKIVSLDYNKTIKFNIKKEIALRGNLKLIKAIVNFFKPYKKGFNLYIHCDAPTGSGLGTSGCLGSMLIKLISEFKKIKISKDKAAEIALEIEREVIKISGGKQDQYAGLLGGFNFLKFRNKYKCSHKKIKLNKNFIEELAYNSLLVYTKKKHYSHDLLSNQIKRYEKKIPLTINSLHKTNKLTFQTLAHFKSGDIHEIGRSLDYAWNLKKKMNPLVSTKEIDLFYKKLKKIGAYGGKILGAGAGGYMLIILPFYLKTKVIKLIKKSKMEVSDFNFVDQGLKIWKIEKSKINKVNKKYFI